MNSKITLIRDKNSGKYLGFEAIVNDEVVEVKNENLEEFKKDLAKYMEQLVQDNYQKEYDNLSNKEIREDLMKRGLITEKLITLNKTPIVAKEKTTVTELPEEANVKGRKKLKVSKKTLALIVGGAIAVSGLGVGITALVNANKKNNSINKEDNYNNQNNDDQFGNTTAPLPSPMTSISNIAYQNNENLSYIYEDMQEFNQNEMPNVAVFANTLENYYQMSDDDFAAISEYRYDNDYQFSGEGTIIPFENAEELTDNIIVDKAYIKYFSDLRNQVVEGFYNDKDENMGLVFINVAGDEIIRCLKFNGSISYDYTGSPIEITYGNLSDEAKKVVLTIATDLYNAMNYNDVFSYNGKNYNMNDVNDTIIELSNKLESSKTK